MASRAAIAAATPDLRVVALRHQSKRGPDIVGLRVVPQLGQKHTGAGARACQRAAPFTEHGPSVAGLPLIHEHRVFEREVVEVGSREDIFHARLTGDNDRGHVHCCPAPFVNEALLVVFKRASRVLQQVGVRQWVWAGCLEAVIFWCDETAEGLVEAGRLHDIWDIDGLRRHDFAGTTLAGPLSLATVDRVMIKSAETGRAATVASAPPIAVAAAALLLKRTQINARIVPAITVRPFVDPSTISVGP